MATLKNPSSSVASGISLPLKTVYQHSIVSFFLSAPQEAPSYLQNSTDRLYSMLHEESEFASSSDELIH